MKWAADISSFRFHASSWFLDFCLDAAGAGEAPAAQGFVNGEKPGHDKNQSQPQHEVHENDAGDEAERTNDAAGDAALPVEVGTEKMVHGKNLPQEFSVASCVKLRQIAG